MTSDLDSLQEQEKQRIVLDRDMALAREAQHTSIRAPRPRC
jgi:hypothetical protein